jgi:hypothetical protein
MYYFYLTIFTTLTLTNLSYSMEEVKEHKAHKEDRLSELGILPALTQAQEPKLHKALPILVKNNAEHDLAISLTYHLEDKNRTRTVHTFLDRKESMAISDYKGVYKLTEIRAHIIHNIGTQFKPLHMTIEQRAHLTHNSAYISLEDDKGHVIHVRRYQKNPTS